MAVTAQQVAGYLDARFLSWPRASVPTYLAHLQPWAYRVQPAPSQLAAELLEDAEFRALQLGTWLTTDQGQLIAEAVKMISPPFLRAEEQLIVEALTLAARQQSRGNQRAGALALGAVAVCGLLAAMKLSDLGPASR